MPIDWDKLNEVVRNLVLDQIQVELDEVIAHRKSLGLTPADVEWATKNLVARQEGHDEGSNS